ncbi:MAG: xanthine dehydrogenase family protein molybdopterin-binding subunit [Hyphomicrobiales bacterium]|nr:xanthine dehydrogenase family protein molybdopterin-binding subunit [Hyphomicrobiales bacterium]
MRPMKFGIGQPARRVEDQRLITGHGEYTSDKIPQNAARAFVLRSPHAHARFRIADLAPARGMPGVLLILTAADIEHLGGLPCLAPVANADGSPMQHVPYPILAKDVVRHVGDAVAFVVAETLAQARDAAENIVVEYENLPAVNGIAAAMKPGAPLVWPDRKGNIVFDAEMGSKEKAEAGFANAHHVTKLKIVNNRLVSNYMETRAVVASYNSRSERFQLNLGSQGVHGIRDVLADAVFRVPKDKVHVTTGDVGGGFGTKAFCYREYPLAAEAAKRLGRPVAWVGDRGEHFLGDAQGRDHITEAELALDPKGRILGLKIDVLSDMGAYLSAFAPFIPSLAGLMAPGLYDVPGTYFRFRGLYTNTLPVDAYRGAGRPEAAYLIERLVDLASREMGIAPDKIRARNFIKAKQMPYKTVMGRVYDSGEFEGHLHRAMEVAGWSSFKERLRESRKRGMIRGIGLASYIEICAFGAAEDAVVRIEKDGSATILVGTQSNGQGHATAYAQIASQHLDLPLEKIGLVQGDSDQVKTGGGTGGSRSIPVGGAAVAAAATLLVDKLKGLASQALEAAAGDLEVVDGTVRVVGTDKALGFAQIASLPGVKQSDVSADGNYLPSEGTYPNGTHICEVEIDPATGQTKIVGYTIVDDFGVVLNPLLLAGQVHGGITQGIGQALLERTVYGEDGQLVTASFMDYAVPRAEDAPSFVFETRNVPCTTNALGVKGAGEAGTIAGAGTVMNAVVDALDRAYGIRHIDMPATPFAIYEAIDAATRQRAA